MWKNCVENAQEHIALHDCVSNGVELSDNVLSFTLDDGFWIFADSKYNSCGNTVRTDKAKINLIGFDEEWTTFYIFKRHYLFGKYICTTRKIMELKTLFEKINSGEWEIEFNQQYHTSSSVLFLGGITTKKKIWALEFQLDIWCEKMQYCWNDIRPDRKW